MTNGASLDGVDPVRFGPKESGMYFEERGVALPLSQGLAKGWSARRKTDLSAFRSRCFGVLMGFDVQWPEIGCTVSEGSGTIRVVSHQAEVFGSFEYGPVAHRVLVGGDHANSGSGVCTQRDLNSWVTNMDTGEVTDSTADNGLPQVTVWPRVRDLADGFTVRDQWAWGDFAGIVALRRVDTVTTRQGLPGRERFGKTMPTVGLVYRLNEDTSIYGSRAEVFRSNASCRTFEGNVLPPETGTQYENDVKALLFDRRVAMTSAICDIRRGNVAEFDFDHGDGDFFNFFKLSPAEIGKGAEIEIAGSGDRHWDWRGSLSYNDLRDANGNVLPFRPSTQVAGHLRCSLHGRNETGPWAASNFTWTRNRDVASTGDPGEVFEGKDDLLVNLNLGHLQVKGRSSVAGAPNLFDHCIVRNSGRCIVSPREFTVTLHGEF